MKDRCHVQDWCHVQQGGHEQRRGHCGHGVRGGGGLSAPPYCLLLRSLSLHGGVHLRPPLFSFLSLLFSLRLSPVSLPLFLPLYLPFFSFPSLLFSSVLQLFSFLISMSLPFRIVLPTEALLFLYRGSVSFTVLRLFFLCSIHCFICAFSGFAFPIVIAVACKHHFYHSFNRLDKTQTIYFLLSTFIYQKSPFTSHSRRIVYLERKTFFMIFFTRSYKQV